MRSLLPSCSLALIAGAAVLAGCAREKELPPLDPIVHRAEVESWRTERELALRKPDGWLTLAGLYWLEEGESSFGSDPGNQVVFPANAPPRLGVFTRAGETVTVRAEPGSGLAQGGKEVTTLELVPEGRKDSTKLAVGSLSFFVIHRGDKVGIRLKDRDSPVLAHFAGIDSFPVSLDWRIEARFEPYDPPRTLQIPTILGTTEQDTCPGAIVFERDGKTHRLEPSGDPGSELFLVFGDSTNGKETYGGGRFLAIDAPTRDGRVVVDFNKAYNPPCVFTPYATCPLPARSNRLSIRVEAGEKMWGEQHALPVKLDS
ncbi:MAG TPA: DUF1684 domain-containing protein [Thermoanaerobaculia bacterium]|nr:DUF1684 domain-containing protein [Thermoanaerobaculia bacterium]